MLVGRLRPEGRLLSYSHSTAGIQERVDPGARDHGKGQLFSRVGLSSKGTAQAVHYASLRAVVHIMICVVGSIWSYEALETL